MGEGGDKTEEPTPHRLREAREKGQVAKSREVTTAVLLLLSYYVLRWLGEFMFKNLAEVTQAILQLIPEAKEFNMGFAGYVLLLGLRAVLFVLGPIFGITFIGSFLAEAAQTGFVFSGEALTPKLEKLNPLEGFKKMFGMQGIVELIKSILKIVVVFYIAWSAMKDDFPYIIVLMETHPWQALTLGGTIAYRIAIRVGMFYIIIALFDYFYRRWEYMRNLKMTKQEIKEEYKRLEGDPQVKQRIRDLQRQAAHQRMMGSVPQADVVVTNPTHIAVALKYDTARMKAPVVLAKGERKNAEAIRNLAEAHEITIVENVELARSLYKTVKVNQEVPADLYQAVAEVLAYVYKIRKERKERRKASLALSPR
ncbi:MAG: flagellar biosynthesis protein FlhB [Candidatus Margulisbacteria bacterium]|nr:flagellar biosynthesis protein FlhB [Candidatus Margulisiibacteriota bacterium]MBU1616998.1 flagellar biosynthesis protein FlhB [Candidatus Margulisiibacteriota bacterium]